MVKLIYKIAAAVAQSVRSFACVRWVVRITTATDLSCLNSLWKFHCYTIDYRCVSQVLGFDHYKRMSRFTEVVAANEPSLLNGLDRRIYVKICGLSSLMVTSPYQWKILDWDKKPKKNPTHQNKQSLIQSSCTNLLLIRRKILK